MPRSNYGGNHEVRTDRRQWTHRITGRYRFSRVRKQKGETNMYLVMGITGNVGGATARHLLEQGKQVRALVRNRQKAAKWADQRVELVDGDWNDATAIAAALKGVEGAFVMLPTVWVPSPDYKEAKDVIANYV
jgi:nucleoside-diphosphate-sugar epimerase